MSFSNQYTLRVDIKKRLSSIVPTFKQGDNGVLKFQIFDDGKKYDLTDYTYSEITFRLPSGQSIVGNPILDTDGILTYNFTKVEMSEVGKIETVLSIYSGSQMVSIQPFTCFIFDSMKGEDLSYIGILQDLIAEVQILKKEVEETLSDANKIKDDLDELFKESEEAENIRNTNEQVRNENEDSRIASEITRGSNENIRQSNESDRKNDESKRESNEVVRIQNEQNRQNKFDTKINEVDVSVTNANNATDKAIQASEAIKGWGTARPWNADTTYERNNIVTDNGSTWQALRQSVGIIPSEGSDWTCLARKGVDGTGAVSSVNGRFPNENGNVQLSAYDVGALTKVELDSAKREISSFITEHGIGTDSAKDITPPSGLFSLSESGFYNIIHYQDDNTMPDEMEDYHTYVGFSKNDSMTTNFYFAISKTTGKTYTRSITKDLTTIINDSDWIEGGGGGSGTGGKFSTMPYDLPTTQENQRSWELPKKSYDKNNDSVIVFHNGVYLSPISWDISGDTFNGYELNIPNNPINAVVDNNVRIMIFKNLPTDGTERFSGNLIEDETISLGKLGQDVQDAINNAGTKIDVVDNLDSDRSDAALSAKQGNVLKNNTDEIAQTVTTLQQEVTDNKSEVTAHLAEIATVDNLGHIKPDGTTIIVDQITGVITSIAKGYEVKSYNGDLNTLIETGIYQYPSYTPNAPTGSAGIIEVVGNLEGSIVTQKVTSFSNVNNVLTLKRTGYNGTGSYVWSVETGVGQINGWKIENVGLSDTINSSSTTTAPTSNALRQVVDLKANRVQESSLTLSGVNGWNTSSTNYFKDQFGIVHINFAAGVGTRTVNTTVATMPIGYRPTGQTPLFAIVTNNGDASVFGVAQFRIYGNGIVAFAGSLPSTATYCSGYMAYRTI